MRTLMGTCVAVVLAVVMVVASPDAVAAQLGGLGRAIKQAADDLKKLKSPETGEPAPVAAPSDGSGTPARQEDRDADRIGDYMRLDNADIGLAAYRALGPAFIDDAELIDMTALQIKLEQGEWRDVAELLASQSRGLNKRKPAFLYDWQSADASNGPLAPAILSAFVNRRPDWGFVTRDRDWSDRERAVVRVFLFAREAIEGRQPEFAARQLAPIFRKHLDAAAASAPLPRFWFELRLPCYGYDFASGAIRFGGGDNCSGNDRRRVPFAKEIVPLRAGTPTVGALKGSRSEIAVPGSAAGRHVYYAPDPPSSASPPEPGGVTPERSPRQQWRGAIASTNKNPVFVALDKSLSVQRIPLDTARAEALMLATKFGSVILERVFVTLQRVELGTGRSEDGRHYEHAVLFMSVDGTEFRAENGDVLHTVGNVPSQASPTGPVVDPSTQGAGSPAISRSGASTVGVDRSASAQAVNRLIDAETANVRRHCEGNSILRSFHDCPCLVDAIARHRRSTGGEVRVVQPAVVVDGKIIREGTIEFVRSYSVLLLPDGGFDWSNSCVNSAGAASYGRERTADILDMSGRDATERTIRRSTCAGNHLAAAYVASPYPDARYIGRLLDKAIEACP